MEAAKKLEFYMTRGISEAMDVDNTFACEIGDLIHRYTVRDWGDLCEDDKQLNEQALKDGGRTLAAYETSRGRVYIITDDAKANPQVTTVLYAWEY